MKIRQKVNVQHKFTKGCIPVHNICNSKDLNVRSSVRVLQKLGDWGTLKFLFGPFSQQQNQNLVESAKDKSPHAFLFPAWCVWCNSACEYTNNLFLTFPEVKHIWEKNLDVFNWTFVWPINVWEFMSSLVKHPYKTKANTLQLSRF